MNLTRVHHLGMLIRNTCTQFLDVRGLYEMVYSLCPYTAVPDALKRLSQQNKTRGLQLTTEVINLRIWCTYSDVLVLRWDEFPLEGYLGTLQGSKPWRLSNFRTCNRKGNTTRTDNLRTL